MPEVGEVIKGLKPLELGEGLAPEEWFRRVDESVNEPITEFISWVVIRGSGYEEVFNAVDANRHTTIGGGGDLRDAFEKKPPALRNKKHG